MKIHNLTLCDQVRQENNGKFLLIGVYTNTIVFDVLPQQFNLSIWCLIEHESVGDNSITIRAQMSSQPKPFFEIEADVEVTDMTGWDPIVMGAMVLIGQPGIMTIEFREGRSEWQHLRSIQVLQRQ